MATFQCTCGATLFFENTSCNSCGCDAGWCDVCNALTTVSLADDPVCPRCESRLAECSNRHVHSVCNGLVVDDGDSSRLCSRCVTTLEIPNTTDPTSVKKWRVLEAGKRRLLFDLDNLGLDNLWREQPPPLRFRFAQDTADEKIMTGHADGVITVNLKEADPVHRESERQRLGEPQRTIIGHLRHEFGHYLDLRLIDEDLLARRNRVFGDPDRANYSDSLDRYYENGPPANWPDQFISPYATVHPWEDFAETTAFYLDMMAVLDTLLDHRMIEGPISHSLDELLPRFESAAIILNEVNRTMGLVDLVPQVVPPPVVEKLRVVHGIVAGFSKS